MQSFNQSQISQNLSKLENWQLKQNPELAIEKAFKFSNYLQGIEFVNQVASEAEKANHHPCLVVEWGKVMVQLSTHEANGLTHRDFDLANEIEKIAKTFSS